MSDAKELWELGQLKGASVERQRIIELLEIHFGCGDTYEDGQPCPDCWIDTKLANVITLIQGEQNA
jgi:hypothetical protein